MGIIKVKEIGHYLWLFLPLLLPLDTIGAVRVLKDDPGYLELEINPSPILYQKSSQSVYLDCTNCDREERIGAPDIPVIRLKVLSTISSPNLIVKTLNKDLPVYLQNINPVPARGKKGKLIYDKNQEFYNSVMFKKYQVSEIVWTRGLPTRIITIPLIGATSRGQLQSYSKIIVTLRFPDVLNNKIKLNLPDNYLREFLNPNGGAYNIAAKVYGRSKRSSQAIQNVSLPLISVEIGDKEVGTTLEDGLYDLEYSSLASALTAQQLSDIITSTRIEKIKVFAGPNLELKIPMDSIPMGPSLQEIPIEVIDNNNNSQFDDGDVIRFFARGTSVWTPIENSFPGDTIPIYFKFESNSYSYTNNYFIDFNSSSDGLRLSFGSDPNVNNPVNKSRTYLRGERDVYLGHCDFEGYDIETGRSAFWHYPVGIDCHTRSFTKNLSSSDLALTGGSLPRYTSGNPLYVGFFTTGDQNGDFDVIIAGDTMSQIPSDKNQYFVYGGAISPDNFSFNSVIWRGNINSVGLEGYTLNYEATHNYGSVPIRIFPETFDQSIAYQLSGNTQNINGLKLKDGIAISKLKITSDIFSDNVAKGENIQYYLYKNSDIMTVNSNKISLIVELESPDLLTDLVSKQDVPQYLIIAPDIFIQEALDLANFRGESAREHAYVTKVARTEDIYRVYSGGRESPAAIRNFIRWVYFDWGQSTTPHLNLQYVLLFGDGHYNFKGLKPPGNEDIILKQNFVPPYEFKEFSTDDFFGYLDHKDVIHRVNAVLDVAVGRAPVDDLEEAKGFVQKAKEYENPKNAGAWRNRIVGTADDNYQYNPISGDTLDNIGHTNDAERIFNIVNGIEAGKKPEKVYLLDYERNLSDNKPEAAQDLLNQINNGALTFNYFGHGGANVWADEGLLVKGNITNKLSNTNKNGMFSVFSCTVGRFEKLSDEGLSEYLLALPEVGAISTVSATRVSTAGANAALARRFYTNLFSDGGEGYVMNVGDALRRAKAVAPSSNINSEKYGIFGEPVVFIRKSNLNIQMDKFPQSINALGCGTISGTISGGSKKGFIQAEIFGGNRNKEYDDTRASLQVKLERGEILYSATVPYENGTFTIPYLFTERLPFGDSTAELKLFAWDREQEKEGSFSLDSMVVGYNDNGTCEITDTEGPEIIITGCDRFQTSSLNFTNDIKLPIPYCLEFIITDSLGGVQISERPDEGTVVEIVNEGSPFKPELSEDGFLQKSFKWTIDEKFNPGKYLLKVNAEDGFGNKSSKTINIELVDENFLEVYQVYNVPNPIKGDGTCFYFGEIGEQNFGDFSQDDLTLSAEIKIYNQRGHLINQLNNVRARKELGSIDKSSCQSRNAWWNGRNAWGKKMGNGIYIYKVKVRQFGKDQQGVQVDRLSSKTNTLVISH